MNLVTLKKTTPKAIKEHICNWCSQTIEIGEVYQSSVNIYDGQKYTWKNHISCMSLAIELDMFDGDPLSEEHFKESVFWAYKDILLESGENIDSRYEYAPFKEQIKLVKEKYLNQKTKT